MANPVVVATGSAPATTPAGLGLIISRGVTATAIPGGGIFVVAHGGDVNNVDAFLAMRFTENGVKLWEKSVFTGGAGPAVATASELLVAGSRVWGFNPTTGMLRTGPSVGAARIIKSLTVRNGEAFAVLTRAPTATTHGGTTARINPTTLALEVEVPYALPRLAWTFSGVQRDTDSAAPVSLVSLADGFGVQGSTRGHNALARLAADRTLQFSKQSTVDSAFYVESAGLGRRGLDLTYVVELPQGSQARVARTGAGLGADAWSRTVDNFVNGSPVRGVLVLQSGHIVVLYPEGLRILEGETGALRSVNAPANTKWTALVQVSGGFVVVGYSGGSQTTVSFTRFTL